MIMRAKSTRILVVGICALAVILLVAGGTYAYGPMMRANENCQDGECPDCEPIGLTDEQREELGELRESFREQFRAAREDILTDEQIERMGEKERTHDHEGMQRSRARWVR